MNKEELKQEAEEYAEGMAKYYASTHEDCIPSQFEKYLRNAYISSAEPREKRIEQLEKDKQYFSDSLDKQIEATLKLDKENAELDCQKNRNKFCYSCANATEKCFKNEIGCPCKKYKSYKDENAELKEKCETLEDMIDEGISYQKAKDYDGVVTSLLEQNHLVTKAKKLLKQWLQTSKASGCDNINIVTEAEQFLSEVEK